ncbi:alpha-L-arabinofuranosidase C-terminal domain-containing protein [Nocardioides sp.]|uniref:alpha-L-arabinofuranosidase C-terminal domain-containing protein n=1 Tax=Nocardioides sp. TaxID=35761 RepID=UPI002BFF0549|nr:alpha-L-arabinofuranosidase C-terminal domain-containing protein [Nocardioides sp.]HXH78698.1 alpha-L-arabinofuranosidase C-terminal domain-containing protein [Nocardioides sp.]
MNILRRTSAAIVAVAVLTSGLAAVTHAVSPAAAVADGDVTWTDTFEGTSLDARWDVVNPDPAHLAVSDGALRIAGQPGDTYQTVNTAKNVVMLDVPAGDFTATADVAAGVAKVYQGAGVIAWQDMDNYVRSGLTFVGGLAPSGTAIETDVETGGAFRAVSFAGRPSSVAERIRVQRVGDTITSSYWTGSEWVTAATTPVAFETRQVGLYALAAQDGTVLQAAFDSFTIEHAPGGDVTPEGTFVLQADGEAPYVVTQDGAVRLSAQQPAASLRLRAAALGDGAVGVSTDEGPLLLRDGALVVGSAGDEPTALRLTDAGGGKVVLRDAATPTSYVTLGTDGALVTGSEANAVRFLLSEVEDGLSTLSIDGDATGASISDTMFGIFYEDINYAADGGLYAEQVRNRSFEFNRSDNQSFTGLTAWEVLNRSGAGTTGVVVDDATRLNEMNRNHLRLVAAAAGDGVRNIGYNNGFAVQAGDTHEGYLWARSGMAQQLTVRLENAAGDATVASATVALDGSDTWKKYPFTLSPDVTTDAGRLVVLAGAPSVIGLDMVSLMPTDRWVGPVNGKSVLRKDLAEKIAAMDPTFLRFPGGCVTNVGTFKTYEESGHADRRRTYQWKETIGPVEERPTNWNFWGYNQTYGIGYLEYFELAEDLDAEPLPVVSVGANGCGGAGIPEMHDPELIDRWVDDTVDLIEFANGGTDTEWGAKRAALGHPEPFGLEMIGLGNEENTTTFEQNFPAFRDGVLAKYPEIQIISNSGPDSSGARFDTLWDFNRAQDVDLVDEHYYRDPQWFLENHYRYDSYDRDDPKVFLGEYASRGNTMYNALAEASYMTGLQRNADVVRLASYAPLLANESHIQWNPDAIWFDNDESWETPNWEVQKLFGNNVGDEVVPSTYDGPADTSANDITGGVFLSTWATSAAYDNVTVTSNETGQTLFSDEFGDASQWTPQAGSWAPNGGRYVQSSTSVTDARSIVTGAYAKDWSNYTLELDATKLAGNEGFLVGFGATGANNFYWWNLGGWNNSRSVLQRASGGNAGEVKALEGQSLETGRNYKIKVVVEGRHIELYLDGVLQMEYDQPAPPAKVFQVVTRDERSGDIVAKVVNTSTSPARTRIDVSDAGVEPTATVTTLSAPSPSSTNTKAAPNTIKPRTREVGGISESFVYEFPASSVTFIRMRTADAVAPVVDDLSLVGQGVNGWYADPATVRVTASDDRRVERLEVSVDDGAWTQLPGDSGQVTVTGNGMHTVRVRAVDAAGNVGEIRPLVVGIDATSPVSRSGFDPASRTVTLTAADAGSGVERVEYRLGGGGWTTYDQPIQVGTAATAVDHRAVDRLGTVEEPGRLEVPAAGASLAQTLTAAVVVTSPVRLGRTVQVDATVTSQGATPTGAVTLVGASGTLATATLVDGRARLTVPSSRLGLGTHDLSVRYGGDSARGASQDTVNVVVTKARSKTRTTVKPRSVGRKVVARIAVASAVEVVGTVTVEVIRFGKKVARRIVELDEGQGKAVLRGLAPGRYRFRATYSGSPSVEVSSGTTSVRVTGPGR